VARLGGKATVWVLEEGRAAPRTVTTGLTSLDRVEITSGLNGDERVIARGHEGLYAGAPVRDVAGPAPATSEHGAGHGAHGTPPAPGVTGPPATTPQDMPAMPGMTHDAPAPAAGRKESPHAGH
jgi:hypothetical protein